MSSMKPEIIRYRHVGNLEQSKKTLETMGKSRFGKKFLGFLKETTWVHSDGFITIKVEPIEGSPAREFRKAIERAGLVGKKIFEDDANHAKSEGAKE